MCRILKLNINRQSINGKLSNTNTTLIYYGLYDNTLNSIDLTKVKSIRLIIENLLKNNVKGETE